MFGRPNVVNKLTLAAALAVSCALSVPARAAATHGGVSSRGHSGGGHSGGGHSGGGHSGGGHSWGGHSGGGGGSHHYGGSYRHHWGGGWGYRPYWGSSWWWGWPYYDTWGPRVYVYSGGHRVATSGYAAIKTDVEPDEAEVWLDGKYVGTADDFDGYPDFLYLEPGAYHLEFRLPGGGWLQSRKHRGKKI